MYRQGLYNCPTYEYLRQYFLACQWLRFLFGKFWWYRCTRYLRTVDICSSWFFRYLPVLIRVHLANEANKICIPRPNGIYILFTEEKYIIHFVHVLHMDDRKRALQAPFFWNSIKFWSQYLNYLQKICLIRISVTKAMLVRSVYIVRQP